MNADPPFFKRCTILFWNGCTNILTEFIKLQAFFYSKALKTQLAYRNLSVFYHSDCNRLIAKNLIFYAKVKLFFATFSAEIRSRWGFWRLPNPPSAIRIGNAFACLVLDRQLNCT